MKIQNGFVSNSSSSSFILAVKGKTKKQALKQLEIKRYVFSDIINQAIACIDESAKRLDENSVFNEMGYERLEDYLKDNPKIKKLFNDGWEVFVGYFSDDGGEYVEAMLCNVDLNYESNDLIIIHEGGY